MTPAPVKTDDFGGKEGVGALAVLDSPLRPDRLLANALEGGLAKDDLALRVRLLRAKSGPRGASISVAFDLRSPAKFDPDVESAVMVVEVVGRDGVRLSCSLSKVLSTRSTLFLTLELSAAYEINGTPSARNDFPLVKAVSLDFIRLPNRRVVALNRSFDENAGDLRRPPR